MNINGKSSKELKEIIQRVFAENKELNRRNKRLESDITNTNKKVKVVTKQLTKTEPFSEFRKRNLAKAYAKIYIDEKVKSSFDTKISDLSMVSLITADFCSEYGLPLRQLGILLYAYNYRSVRKKDLYVGRGTGQWYSQTVEAMMNKGLIMRVNPDMKKWIYFSLTPDGEKVVRDYNKRVKGYLVQDDKETEGIKRTSA